MDQVLMSIAHLRCAWLQPLQVVEHVPPIAQNALLAATVIKVLSAQRELSAAQITATLERATHVCWVASAHARVPATVLQECAALQVRIT